MHHEIRISSIPGSALLGSPNPVAKKRKPGVIRLVSAFAVALMFMGCESNTAPARVAPNVSTTQSDQSPPSPPGHATVVIGTGNAALDVPAVQAAVDIGGDVVLKGHFDFGGLGTVPVPTFLLNPPAAVLVSKAV